jgi:prevent-host-death family protein
MRWQVQEAKQRFSEVLRAAESGEPQIVTKHGEEVAVVLDIAAYRRLRGEPAPFMEYLLAAPSLEELDEADDSVDDDFTLTRRRDLPRELDLAD